MEELTEADSKDRARRRILWNVARGALDTPTPVGNTGAPEPSCWHVALGVRTTEVMKRYAVTKVRFVVTALAILGGAEWVEADYLVILRNGNEFQVKSYEVVEDKIVYKRFAGKVAIPKSIVAEIVNLDTGEKRAFNRFPPGLPKMPRR